MGQYHSIYNKTKKEYFNFGNAKLWEHVGGATSAAFLLLLCNSNGRGGGDFYVQKDYNIDTGKYKKLSPKLAKQDKAINELQGSWIGDVVVVQGDYAKPSDKGFIENFEGFKNITKQLEIALVEIFDGGLE